MDNVQLILVVSAVAMLVVAVVSLIAAIQMTVQVNKNRRTPYAKRRQNNKIGEESRNGKHNQIDSPRIPHQESTSMDRMNVIVVIVFPQEKAGDQMTLFE